MSSTASPSRGALLLASALSLSAALAGSAGAQQPEGGPAAVSDESWALLQSYCVECHNFEDWAGGVAFDVLRPDDIAQDAAIWEEAVRKLRGRLMPPPGQPQPDDAALARFVLGLETALDHAAAQRGVHPGRVMLHRLNRTEYANQIEAILGLRIDPAELLPPDTESEGFDNIAEVLQVSPTFLEQYVAAARDISIRAVGAAAPPPDRAAYRFPQSDYTAHVDGLPLGTRGGSAVRHHFPADGEYAFSIPISSKDGSLLRSYPAGWVEHRNTLVLLVDGVPVFEGELGGEDDLRAVDQHQQTAVDEILRRFVDIRVPVEAGERQVTATFRVRTLAESDDLLQPLTPGQGVEDAPVVIGLDILGPFEARAGGDTASRRKIFSCHPDEGAEARACAESIMARLAAEAYRRPATHGEVETLLGFYDAGAEQSGFETGVQKAIMAMLASTKFLYRADAAPPDLAPGQVYELDAERLATRLSFFLWSQGPDEELLALAETGALADPAAREAQVRRMLADPRAAALVDNFAFRWLGAGDVAAIDPDPRLFPEFDEALREAFVEELRLFVGSVLLEDRSIVDLLTAQHSFLNERLARHYGVAGVTGSRFRRVELEESRRWGLLGKGAVLLQTSYPNRTSPVLRGAWILETLVGAPPAAPPPDVETDLDAGTSGGMARTVRDRLEEHRADPSCNQCHGVIDPLGLALENFDATGAWRDRDRDAGDLIDASGQLAGGAPVEGPDDLRTALAGDPDQFARTFAEKLLMYALGRAVEHEDMPAVRRIVGAAEEDDYRFSSLVLAVVESEQFRMSTAPGDPGAGH